MPPRFFIPAHFQPHQAVRLPDAAFHHAVRVLRLSDRASIEVFNGDGSAWMATLEITGKSAFARLQFCRSKDPVTPVKLGLIQALSTADKLNWTIEKAIELGADEIEVCSTERSKVKMDEPRTARKLERWREIALSACMQCGRNSLPAVHWAPDWSPAVQAATHTFILDPRAEATWAKVLQPLDRSHMMSLKVMIGPESGFSARELEQARAVGAKSVNMGWRILRTETAGPAAIAILDQWRRAAI